MREIKFKAFIKTLGWLVTVDRINFDCETVEADLSGEGDTAEYNFDEVELVEYAGLNDMNAIEVYEGDVLHRDAYGDMFVEFHNGAFCLVSCNEIQRINWTPKPIWSSDIQCRKVIGNIYKNPELLTT